FTPASLNTTLKQLGDAGVLICTNQALQALQKESVPFNRLRKWTTLLLIDEGHREPAPRWAAAVRELEKPTVLFTATPYRNDLQLFNISPDYFYSYTFGEAVEDRIVRTVEFIDGSWPRDRSNTVREFTAKLIEARKSAEAEVRAPHGQMRV